MHQTYLIGNISVKEYCLPESEVNEYLRIAKKILLHSHISKEVAVLFSSRHEKPKQTSQEASSLPEVLQQASKSDDFIQYALSEDKNGLTLSCYQSLVDEEKINRFILSPLQLIDNNQIIHIEELIRIIPIKDIQISSDPAEVELKLTQGYIAVQLNNHTSPP